MENRSNHKSELIISDPLLPSMLSPSEPPAHKSSIHYVVAIHPYIYNCVSQIKAPGNIGSQVAVWFLSPWKAWCSVLHVAEDTTVDERCLCIRHLEKARLIVMLAQAREVLLISQLCWKTWGQAHSHLTWFSSQVYLIFLSWIMDCAESLKLCGFLQCTKLT